MVSQVALKQGMVVQDGTDYCTLWSRNEGMNWQVSFDIVKYTTCSKCKGQEEAF